MIMKTIKKVHKVYNTLDKEFALDRENAPMYEVVLERGVVIKIQDYFCNEYDYHNHWGVIIANKRNRFTIFVDNDGNDIIDIKYENIKWVIGTLELCCVNIGQDRHQNEVVPLINKALEFKLA